MPVPDLETPETEETPLEGAAPAVDEGGDSPDLDAGEEGSQSTTKEDGSSDDDTKTDTGDGDNAGATSGKKSAYATLLAKYDGDPEALAEGVWNQGNSLSEVNKRLKNLEVNLQQALAPPPVDVQALVDDDPYVKEAATDLRTTDAKAKATHKEQVQHIAEHGKLERQVAKLEGKLESAAPEDRDDIKDDLREAKADRKEAARNYRESKRELDSIERELRGAAQKFREAEANAKQRLERSQEQSQTLAERQVVLRSDFTDAVAAEATKFGIPTDGSTFKVLHQSIKDRITGYLRTLPRGAPGINTPEAGAVLMEEYVEAMGLKSRFQDASKRKRANGQGGGTKTGLTAPDLSGDKKGAWTADYARKRAEQLMP